MPEDKVAVFRGKQVSLAPSAKAKWLTFVMPEDPPVDDEEVIDREETIAKVEIAIRPYREVVKLGEQLQKALRDDVTNAMIRRETDSEQPSLFPGAPKPTKKKPA